MNENQEEEHDPGDVSGVDMLPFESAPPSEHQMQKMEAAGLVKPVGGLTLGFANLTPAELASVDVDKLDKLLAMKERMDAQEAEKAFSADFAKFQADVPQIPKRGRGNHDAPFALYEDMRRAVDPVLTAHGFSISFGALELSGGEARMTGTLRHKGGHKLTEAISLPVAKDLRANDTQKGGSAASYCQRYLVKAMLALVDCGEDDDGQAAGTETVTEKEALNLYELQSQVDEADGDRMRKWVGVEEWEDCPRSKYASVCKAFGRKINAEKA